MEPRGTVPIIGGVMVYGGVRTDRDRDKMRQLMTKVRLDCHPDLASLVYTTAE